MFMAASCRRTTRVPVCRTLRTGSARTDVTTVAADLVEFLRARLDEDEKAARRLIAAADRESYGCGTAQLRLAPGADTWLLTHGSNLLITPARVLAEVAAKRRIIDLHWPAPWHPRVNSDIPQGTAVCSTCGDMEWYAETAPCDTIKALAQPYADHPDFDPAWKL